MLILNSKAVKLYIATTPDVENKNYSLLIGSTTMTTNLVHNATEQNYFSNMGYTTKIITGGALSISVGIDYNKDDPVHLYLMKLALGDFGLCNNQYVAFELINIADTTTYITGKTAIQFKVIPSSGAANELVKLEFDLFPQDVNWETTTTSPLISNKSEDINLEPTTPIDSNKSEE